MSVKAEFLERRVQRRRPLGLSKEIVIGVVGFSDAAAVLISAILIGSVFDGSVGVPTSVSFGFSVLACGLLLLTYHAADLYRFPVVMRPGRYFKKVLLTTFGVGLALAGLTVLLKVPLEISRTWALAWWGTSLVLLICGRFIISGGLHRLAASGRIGRRIAVYGAGPQGERLIERISALREPWNRIVGVFDDRQARCGPFVAGHPVHGTLKDLINWGHHDRPDEILVALPWSAEQRIVEILHSLAVLPANVRLAPEFQRLELIQGRTNWQFGLPMLNAYEKPMEGWGRVWKRAFDFVLSAVVIVGSAPLLLLIALLVRLESPGPVLFCQPRFGFNNRLINVYKFRTMRAEDSDPLGVRLTARDDQRITRIGAFLRQSSLDELPQLLNVLNGEMSLVGPRPHAIRTTAGGKQCDAVVSQYAARHKVKPGITGWAQVNGWRGTMETEEQLIKRLEHDLHYINNWSALFDVKILAMTVWAVLSTRNSY